MKFAPLFCLLLCLSAAAEPAKKEPVPVKPIQLPVIEVHSETPATAAPAAGNSTYELPPIEGQKAQKMSGAGRNYWGGAAGAGPGRAWPTGNAPGTPGAAPGAVMNPTGFPGRF
jgi:hypothetical protein